MKTKNFDDYLEKRLSKDEINEIKQQAKLEFTYLKSLQQDVALAISEYMQDRDIGFNELVRRLNMSPSQVAKIQKGEANITLTSLAHIAALLKRQPHLEFSDAH